jgi:hypothetical protein
MCFVLKGSFYRLPQYSAESADDHLRPGKNLSHFLYMKQSGICLFPLRLWLLLYSEAARLCDEVVRRLGKEQNPSEHLSASNYPGAAKAQRTPSAPFHFPWHRIELLP